MTTRTVRSPGPASAARTKRPGPIDRLRGAHPVAGLLLHPLTLALVAAALVHLPALDTWFAQDDVSFIARARGLVPTPWSLARPLSEGVVWRAMHAAFGLNPLPYHVFAFALHLANTALVYAIGVRLLGGPWAAGAAATLFGASAIGFTPLHWISSGMVELSVTLWALAAFLLYLIGRGRAAGAPEGAASAGGAALPLGLSAIAVFAALVSKENAVLLPLVFVAAHFRLGVPRAPGRTLLPGVLAAAAYAVAFAVTLRSVHYVGSLAYAMSADPVHLARNAATYLKWIASPGVPVRDVVAAVDPAAAGFGATVAILIVLLLWLQRRDARHPAEVGAVWFAVLLAPVLPLVAHTYLYYLYLPWAGLCWMVAALGARVARRPAAGWRWAAAALVIAVVALEANGVGRRESGMVGTLPLDKTMRESLMLGNAVTDLRRAGVGAGDSIAFVNPAPPGVRIGLARLEDVGPEAVTSYVPLEGAMRGGESIRVFFPGATYLGFARDLPPEWARARVFLFQDEGTLRDLGRGAAALTELGLFALRLEDWALAERSFTRAFALGDTLPDAAYGMIAAAFFQGRRDEALRRGAEFLARWPDDPRAAELALRLRQEAALDAGRPPGADATR